MDIRINRMPSDCIGLDFSMLSFSGGRGVRKGAKQCYPAAYVKKFESKAAQALDITTTMLVEDECHRHLTSTKDREQLLSYKARELTFHAE